MPLISVFILAKNEATRIGRVLEELARQTLLTAGMHDVIVVVLANGCTDNTEAVARGKAHLFEALGVAFKAEDLKIGGKSRTWNKAVHSYSREKDEYLIFLDADIEFFDDAILEEMLNALASDSRRISITGYPLKETVRKRTKSVRDRISLLVSRNTRHVDATCGQLYVVRAGAAKDVWMPLDIPGEDGFLNAMINTAGFTHDQTGKLISEHFRPTHYFEPVGARQFLKHERRMIVGTVINRLLFEHFWSLDLKQPVGRMIKSWNEDNPAWLSDLIQHKVAERPWIIPNDLLFERLRLGRGKSVAAKLGFVPFGLLATLATMPAAVLANRSLKKGGAEKVW